MTHERFGVYLVSLDPTIGAEMRKSRPCVIISPDEMNEKIFTVIVAPLTSIVRNFPFRSDSKFGGRPGQIALDQMRAVDKKRLVKRIGKLDRATSNRMLRIVQDMFA